MVKLRKASTATDLATVFDLILATGISTERSLITATLHGSSYWLAEQGDGRVVGCIGLEYGDRASLLRSAAVLPEMQGHGLGKLLVRHALKAAQERGDGAVYLFSHSAGKYWQRLGFRPTTPDDVAAALRGTPQVQGGLERGWLWHEPAFRLDFPISTAGTAVEQEVVNVPIRLDGTLLLGREQEWAHHLAQPQENPLTTRVDFVEGFTLQNDLCVYTQNPRHFDGLPHSGLIVTKRPCETVFDLTPEEAAAVHALLAEVRAYLDATAKPDGYTVGWNVYPAGGQHIPHVHLHVIPRWNTDASAGAGLRYFLKAAAQAAERRS